MAHYLHKIILAKTWYKTHNNEFLAIVEALKTCQDYLKSCNYKALNFINDNNLCLFIDTKSLSSCQVCWAPKVSRYYF